MSNRKWITKGLRAPAAGTAALLVAGVAGAQSDGLIASWVQYTADGIEVRAVASDRCPSVLVDGESVGMLERAQPTEGHANLVCAAAIETDVKSISLNGRELPVPVKERPKKIVVMGDTGCRLSDGHGLYQECDNDSIWPFAHVAKAVEAYGPDLIIYTGDYIYREAACPEGNNGCVGSPHGDNEATWKADWLLPAAPVQVAAPLVLIRGNHETCKRAGTGWFRYLDARPEPAECLDSSDPWVVSFKSLQVGVMDVANLEDPDTGDPLDGLFAEQLDTLDAELTETSWIATHRTFWGYGADDDTGELTTPTQELQDAVREAGLPRTVQLLIGAHIHLAEVLDFGGERPPQLVVANSGTQLVPRVDPPAEIDGVAIQDQEVVYQYGFVSMEPSGAMGWSISFRDVDGRVLEKCSFDGRRVRCKN